jgi:hypothetical protein
MLADRHSVACDLPGPAASEPAETEVPISALRIDLSVRVDGVDQRHVAVLAEVLDTLPPVVVHRQSMRIVDGLHRLEAIARTGRQHIRAVFIDGDDVDALAQAVRLNTWHGLPLSRRDRRAVVDRLLKARPHWSDRRIAALAGVSHRTVGAARSRSSGQVVQSTIGRDERVRHRDVSSRRAQAAALAQERPQLSAREIAKVTGLSPATILDVRKRRDGRPTSVPAAAAPQPPDLGASLQSLRSDPSLRYTAAGRILLRVLFATSDLRDPEAIAAAVPGHRKAHVAELARRSAERWLRLARAVEAVDGGAGS